MDATGAVSNPTDYVKIVDLGTGGTHVKFEIFQAFAAEVPFVAVQKTDESGSVSCTIEDDSPVPAGDLVMRVTSKCDTKQMMSSITVYAGNPGSTATPGCTDGVDDVTAHQFDLPCECDVEEVTLQTKQVNPPVAVDDSTTTPEDTPVDISVLPNDSDPENDPLTVISTTTPSAQGGTCTIQDAKDGIVKYM